MLSQKQVRAIIFSILLVGSVFGANVTLAAVESGGDATGEAGPANDIVAPNTTINSTGDSTITVAYNASREVSLDELHVLIETASASFRKNVTTYEGTVNYTIPEGDLAGGNHHLGVQLLNYDNDPYRLATNSSVISNPSNVTLESRNFEAGPHYPDQNITATASLSNPTATAENYTVTLYGKAPDGRAFVYDRPSGHAVTKTVEVPAGATDMTVPLNASFEDSGDYRLRVNEGSFTPLDVNSPINATSISVVDDPVYANSNTTVQATIRNIGGANGTYTATALNNYGREIGKTSVQLNASESKSVEFDVVIPGTYVENISILNKTASVDPQSPLNISPTVVTTNPTVGEPVTVETQITNEHGANTTFGVSTYFPSTEYDKRHEISLDQGESKTITDTITYDIGGKKNAYVRSERVRFTVQNPLNVSEYSFNKTAPSVDEPVQLTANVTNTGDAGEYPLALQHQYRSDVYGVTNVSMEAGETKTVQLTTSFDSPRTHQLQLNNQTDVELTVRTPVRVTNHTLSDNSVYTGESVTITANVTNTGSSGTYEIPVTRWGSTINSTEVTLDHGETKQISLPFTSNNPIGEHDRVSFGNASIDTLSVENRIVVDSVNIDDGVAPGETITAEVTVSNPTDKVGSDYYDGTLGGEYDLTELTLEPGETKTVTISGSYSETGRHYATVASESIRVFVTEQQTGTANLTIPDQYLPSEATVGQSIHVPVRVTNNGNATGVGTVNFSVDGSQTDSMRVSAAPGGEGMAWFETTFDSTGSHTYTVGDRTKTVEVREQVITNTSVTYLNGTEPVESPKVNARFSSYGLLVALTDSAGYRDLTRIGADTSTEFRVNVTVNDYDPNVVVDTGDGTTWSTTQVGPNTTRVSVVISPSNLQYRNDPPTLENWDATNDTADAAMPAGAWMRIGNGEYSRYAVNGSVLEGMTISTNAQRFRQPMYIPGTDDTAPELRVKLAGPHLTVDGDVYQGHYSAFLPESLLTEWNVTDPSQLTANYSATDGESDYTVETVDGGVRLTMDIHYSAGTLSITKAQTSEDTGDSSESGDSTDETDGASDGPSGTDDTTEDSTDPGDTDSETTDGGSEDIGGQTSAGGGGQTEATARTSIMETDSGITTYVGEVPSGDSVDLNYSIATGASQSSIVGTTLDFTFDHPDRARLEVSGLGDSPQNAAPVSEGTALSYFAIDAYQLDQDALDSATVRFTVNESALPSGTTPAAVRLYHYDGDSWEALETTHVDGAHYRATTESFSEFAIVAQADATSGTSTPASTDTPAVTETSESTTTQETTADAETTQGETTQTDSPGFGVGAALTALLGLLFAGRRIDN